MHCLLLDISLLFVSSAVILKQVQKQPRACNCKRVRSNAMFGKAPGGRKGKSPPKGKAHQKGYYKGHEKGAWTAEQEATSGWWGGWHEGGAPVAAEQTAGSGMSRRILARDAFVKKSSPVCGGRWPRVVRRGLRPRSPPEGPATLVVDPRSVRVESPAMLGNEHGREERGWPGRGSRHQARG